MGFGGWGLGRGSSGGILAQLRGMGIVHSGGDRYRALGVSGDIGEGSHGE